MIEFGYPVSPRRANALCPDSRLEFVRLSSPSPTSPISLPWQVCIDTGGTFSDCIATAPDGSTRRAKVLSHGALRARVLEVLTPSTIRIQESWNAPPGLVTGWTCHKLPAQPTNATVLSHRQDNRGTILEHSTTTPLAPGDAIELRSPEESPIVGARLLTRTPAGRPLPPMQLRLATTRGTNALLERRAGPVAFFVTHGFSDLLTIGTQQRPDIFALNITKPRPLYDEVIEVKGRLSVDGSILRPLSLDALLPALAQLRAKGIRSAAIALIHSWINPAHEQALAQLLRANGFDHISCSHEMAAAIKFLPRAETAVVDAYLAPVIKSYLGNVASALSKGSTIHAMTSSGGLVSSYDFRPKDSLLSGPAGGVVGAAAAARRSGFTKLISFDMGGTSTDVARYDNDHTYVFEHHVGDAHIVAPAVAVESVAAGGGSICWFDQSESALRVGPHSAGATPGPACYGAGGPLTITDANLLLGRLDPSHFGIPISIDAARAKAEELLAQVQKARADKLSLSALLEGLIDLADERMAQAIRTISIAKGYDPADHILVAFGGAGGQHACAIAQRLGMTKVLIPEDVGLLSAKGLSEAAVERFAQRQVLRDLDTTLPALPGIFTQLESESRAAVQAQGVPADNIVTRRRLVHLRLKGQDTSLPIEVATNSPTKPELGAAFTAEYQSLYGYPPTNRAIEVESVRVIASSYVNSASSNISQTSSSLRPSGTHGCCQGRSEALRARPWSPAPGFTPPPAGRAKGRTNSSPLLLCVPQNPTSTLSPPIPKSTPAPPSTKANTSKAPLSSSNPTPPQFSPQAGPPPSTPTVRSSCRTLTLSHHRSPPPPSTTNS